MKSPVSDAAAPTRFYFSELRVRQLMAGMLAACTGPDLSYLAAVVARLQNARDGYRVGLVLCSPYRPLYVNGLCAPKLLYLLPVKHRR